MSKHPMFLNAQKSFRQGDYQEALKALNVLLDVQSDPATYALLAKTFLKLDMKREAAQSWQLAAEADDPQSGKYRREAIKLWFELNEIDIVLALARPLAEEAQKEADLAFYIASCFLLKKEKELVRVYLDVLADSDNSKHNSLAIYLLSNMPEDSRDRKTMRKLLKRYPDSTMLIQGSLVTFREVNDYEMMSKYEPMMRALLGKPNSPALAMESPFYNLHWIEDESINKLAGKSPNFSAAPLRLARRSMPHVWSDKIRVGYLSSDFWARHATMKLVRGVLEDHDRERFEITLFCHTAEDRLDPDEVRAKWGNSVIIRDMNTEEAAETIKSHNIDILVDMKGQTRDGRAHLLNKPLAPIHVEWLGFPGSMSNIDVDYIIGDRIVLPDASKPHYWEKFCRLPECYQPNDVIYRPEHSEFTRKDAGLPEDVFVFASFNATRKISLQNIELWAQILKAAPNSVLWLLCAHDEARDNIIKKLRKLGMPQDRIIFMPLVDYQHHVARMRLADLGLDTFPVNGHTTTSEQLWGELPVLTKKGTHFASRVSESLLTAIGLPELIAKDEEDYLMSAVSLYQNRQKIAEYKQRLRINKYIKPLFDHRRFRQHLESAFEMMVDRAKRGLAPDHFDVPALPARTEPFHWREGNVEDRRVKQIELS